MEITRDIYFYFDQWKDSRARKPLLLRGARQIGKSTAVRTWGKAKFKDSFLEINLEEQPALANIFRPDRSVDRILDELQLITGVQLKTSPSLLFIDEIQTVPEAITALRYFYEKMPQLHVIGAGSLIEFQLEKISFPVGRVQSVFMHPLTFFEFLGSLGKGHLISYLQTITEPVQPIVHDELLSLLRTYYRIGGMPEAVKTWMETKDLAEVSNVHSRLLVAYKDDFPKYGTRIDIPLLEDVYTRIPYLIASSRIKYSQIISDVRSNKIKDAIALLKNAGLISKVISSFAKKPPLKLGVKDKFFKILFLDIGLLQHAVGFDWRTFNPTDNLTDTCNGVFAEQFVGQEFLANTEPESTQSLYYWQREVHGSDAEVDYLIESSSGITPIEVKSGHRGTLKSLQQYRQEFSPKKSVVFSQQNIGSKDDLIWIPLYMAQQVKRLIAEIST